MARDSFRTYKESSPAQARSASSGRSAASNVRSAGAASAATPASGRSSTGSALRSSARANNAESARSTGGDAARPSNARGAEATRSSARTPAGDRERSIETGREQGRNISASAAAAREANRFPQAYQYAAGLAAASPFGLMRRFADDMDRLLHDFGFNQNAFASPFTAARDLWRQEPAARGAWSPQIETFRRGDDLIVRADLPGLKREDVKVEVEGDVLSVSGERADEREENRDDYYRSERSYGRFYRAIPLPDGVKADDCHASFRDGVLEVMIAVPRGSATGRREVPVSE